MKNVRITAGLAALGALAALTLFVVVPALASSPGQQVPPASSPLGVTPVDYSTGGQRNDCSVFYPGGTTLHKYLISDPKSKTYTDSSTGATFTLTLNPPNTGGSWPAYAKGAYFSFASTGAAVIDVGVRGDDDSYRYAASAGGGHEDEDTVRYAYSGQPAGGAVADGYLHGPARSTVSKTNLTPTRLEEVDQVTFCYAVLSPVSGTVYQDANANGTDDAGDQPLSGWTVRAYKGVTAGVAGGGTKVAETQSAADGSYSLRVPVDPSTTYRVCEAPPSGAWAQSQPLPSAPSLCTGSGELAKGYDFTATSTQGITGRDFGNVPAVAGQCDAPFGETGYLIQTQTCKSTVDFAFASGTTPSGAPFVSVWSGDQTAGLSPMVEKINFPDPISNGQPTYTKLLYTDTFPFVLANVKPMQYCNFDPRVPGSEFTLQSTTGVLPGSETSCVISITTAAPAVAGGPGTLLAYVYSAIDGLRTTT
jgi:hypothetical protein